MRTLRVVGLHEDGQSVVCEDPDRREQFLIPADERLRAAARGDATRLGQIEIELESQMRPREIQARIRAGDTVEQVATNANVDVERVRRFAHPVLQERSRNAQLAQQAHPTREDGPDVRTLAEVVSYAFGVRAQDYGQASWDAWRADDGRWIVALHWQAGRSDNSAHWSFEPGPQGGTVTAIDEDAEDLLNPDAAPRGPRAITHDLERAHRAAEHDQQESNHGQYRLGEAPESDAMLAAGGETVPADDGAAVQGDDHRSTGPVTDRRNHPVVPAWEDVLLGVRSQRGS